MFYGKVWAIFIVFVAHFMQDSTSALKCWQCASDSSASKFCGRNLDSRNLTNEQKQANYVECKSAVPNNARGNDVVPKCEVYKQIINNFDEVYIRGCTLETKNAPADQCLSAYSDTSYVTTEECRTCSTDGCNEMLDSASIGVKVSTVVGLIALTVLFDIIFI